MKSLLNVKARKINKSWKERLTLRRISQNVSTKSNKTAKTTETLRKMYIGNRSIHSLWMTKAKMESSRESRSSYEQSI